MLFLFHRGEQFRKEFYNLGEVRGLIPRRVKIMALTATATTDKKGYMQGPWNDKSSNCC